jgi:DNA replication protein DnaC
MEYHQNLNPFINIPKNKYQDFLDEVHLKYREKNSTRLTIKGALLYKVFSQYYNSNIPVDYWDREMQDFEGDPALQTFYQTIISDISASYKLGASYCLLGSHGKGKTMAASCVLKRVAEQGKYSALYVNLVDIIHVLLDSSSKNVARDYLLKVDFLVIDEFDARFMGTDHAADLFGRILEPTLRGRVQNRMPTIICTNSTDPAASFAGQLQQSFKSLLNKFSSVVAVKGKDFRSKK